MDETYRRLRQGRDRLITAIDNAGDHLGLAWPEISGGQVVIGGLMDRNPHQMRLARLRQALEPHLAGDLELLLSTDLEAPELGILRVPDLLVVDVDPLLTDNDALAPESCHLVAEVVSVCNPDTDYVAKRADYARMEIPHYLIVDPCTGGIGHLSAPGGGVYRSYDVYTFGQSVPVGAWTLETGSLARYDAP